MFSREFYEILHIIGIAFIFAAMGGVAVHAANGGTRKASTTRTMVAVLHGLGALMILTGGFGMMARMDMMGKSFPGWLLVKLAVWVLLSGLILLPYRSISLAKPFLIGLPLLGGLAAYMALYKPFV